MSASGASPLPGAYRRVALALAAALAEHGLAEIVEDRAIATVDRIDVGTHEPEARRALAEFCGDLRAAACLAVSPKGAAIPEGTAA